MAASGSIILMEEKPQHASTTNFPKLFSSDDTFEKIIKNVKQGGSLNEFAFLVKKLIAQEKLNHEPYSLIENILTIDDVQAPFVGWLVIKLEISIKKYGQTELLRHGKANCFLEIIQELLPDKYQEVLAQVGKTAIDCYMPSFDETNEKIKSDHLKLLNNIIDTFSTESLKHYLTDSKRASQNNTGFLKDNLYYLKLIELIHDSFSILVERGETMSNECLLNLANFLCQEIIPEIKRELPSSILPLINSMLFEYKRQEGEVDFNKGIHAYIDCLGSSKTKDYDANIWKKGFLHAISGIHGAFSQVVKSASCDLFDMSREQERKNSRSIRL